MRDYVQAIIEENDNISAKFQRECLDSLINASKAIVETFLANGKLLILGNGGSAADAQHMAAEFVNRFRIERPPLPAIALSTDTSVITSISNDYSYSEVFEKQIKAFLGPNDAVLGISTSGNSESVIKALRAAAKEKVTVVGFTGLSGGKMAGLCDVLLKVPSENTARIQEYHILSAHIICSLVDDIMFGRFCGL